MTSPSPLQTQWCNSRPPYQCCFNQYYKESQNTCEVCPAGRFGWNCKSNCTLGFYGELCRRHCECDIAECHHETGCVMGTLPSTQVLFTVFGSVDKVDTRYNSTVTGQPVTFSLIGIGIGLCVLFLIVSCILYVLWLKNKKHVWFPCIASDDRRRRQHEDNEVPTVRLGPPCGGGCEGLYDEVRYSQIINRHSAAESCGRESKDKDNSNQKCRASNAYDHLHLKIERSELGSGICSVRHGKTEEYHVVCNESRPVQKRRTVEEKSECENHTLVRDGEGENTQTNSLLGTSNNHLSTEILKMDQNTKENQEQRDIEANKDTVGLVEKRPYSLVQGLPSMELTRVENELESHVSVHTCTLDKDKQTKGPRSEQTSSRPYSFAKLPECPSSK
ncbi:uncharacterized protein LOC111135011 isoform X3 [Crassostrea virginica]